MKRIHSTSLIKPLLSIQRVCYERLEYIKTMTAWLSNLNKSNSDDFYELFQYEADISGIDYTTLLDGVKTGKFTEQYVREIRESTDKYFDIFKQEMLDNFENNAGIIEEILEISDSILEGCETQEDEFHYFIQLSILIVFWCLVYKDHEHDWKSNVRYSDKSKKKTYHVFVPTDKAKSNAFIEEESFNRMYDFLLAVWNPGFKKFIELYIKYRSDGDLEPFQTPFMDLDAEFFKSLFGKKVYESTTFLFDHVLKMSKGDNRSLISNYLKLRKKLLEAIKAKIKESSKTTALKDRYPHIVTIAEAFLTLCILQEETNTLYIALWNIHKPSISDSIGSKVIAAPALKRLITSKTEAIVAGKKDEKITITTESELKPRPVKEEPDSELEPRSVVEPKLKEEVYFSRPATIYDRFPLLVKYPILTEIMSSSCRHKFKPREIIGLLVSLQIKCIHHDHTGSHFSMELGQVTGGMSMPHGSKDNTLPVYSIDLLRSFLTRAALIPGTEYTLRAVEKTSHTRRTGLLAR